MIINQMIFKDSKIRNMFCLKFLVQFLLIKIKSFSIILLMKMMDLILNLKNDIYAKLIPIKRKNLFKQVIERNPKLIKKRFFFYLLEETSADNAGQDNRDLCDEGSVNQTLQHDEIEQLKSEGASGQTIISQLVSKSATFEKKTVYSQQKYLNKKKKK